MYKNKTKLGILGGGQLGRMLIQAAIDFDLEISVLDPDPTAPAGYLAHHFTCGSFTDEETVFNFGKDLDVVTIEIEKVNTQALRRLKAKGVKVHPDPELIETIQDKRVQKQFFVDNSLPTSLFLTVNNLAELTEHADFLPAANKLAKDGYDGKGVKILKNRQDAVLGFDAPGILEKFVEFEKELAIIVARNENGDIATYPVVEMVFNPELNLVDYLFSPADIVGKTEVECVEIAFQIAEKLNLVGILAIEFFLLPNGEVLINEMAPRPHNSGHHTIKANAVSQFEQHLRAILNLPLGSTVPHCPAAMINILGSDAYCGEPKYHGFDKVAKLPNAFIHLYGKAETKPGRKMGHITVLGKDLKQLKKSVAAIRGTLYA